MVAGRSSMSKGGSNSTYNPQSLLSAVCCHAPVFKGKQQHDAHELMRMLLDGLQVGLLCWGVSGGLVVECCSCISPFLALLVFAVCFERGR
jgi:hypothetical protein